MRRAAANVAIGLLSALGASGCCVLCDVWPREQQSSAWPQSEPNAARPDCFPYRTSPPPPTPCYARYRPERQPPLLCALRAMDYLLKYEHKRRSAGADAQEYFAWQRETLARMAADRADDADVSIALVGDLMWLRKGWGDFLSPEVLEHLNGHDVVIGNLETAVASDFAVPRLPREPAILRYNSPPELVTSFRRPDGRSTFTALTLANNHAMDCGVLGAGQTAELLAREGILHTGTRADRAAADHVVFNARGIRVGLCAATWGLSNRHELASEVRQVASLAPLPGEPLDIEPIRAALDAMGRAGAEFKVVAVHWGYEYEMYPDARVMQVARQIVQAGADLVVGSHPHVVQPAEVCFVNGYERRLAASPAAAGALPPPPPGCLLTDARGEPRKALVLYSLGNFTTAMGTFLCRAGAIESLRLRRDPATGRVDWLAPRTRLSYNVPGGSASGGSRLVLLSAYLSAGGDDELSASDRQDLQLLRRLVAGQ